MPSAESYRLPVGHRIRKRPEFLTIRNSGRLLRTPHFLVQTCSRIQGPTRLGVTVSRRIGNAVIRNRVKRKLREFFRLHYTRLPEMMDISIIARSGAERLTHIEVQRELVCLFVAPKGDSVRCSGGSLQP